MLKVILGADRFVARQMCKAVVFSTIILLWQLVPIGLAAVPIPGLYATFKIKRGTSNVGEFTCRLAFEEAPRTVANFVGLAEGSLAWIDLQKGHAVKRPLFNGITFHRVVTNFVIQSGSPDGRGDGGPGYNFRDEFVPTLRHSKAGILSMANSGLNSNGSQFFVTLRAAPELDDVHSVFGEVTQGLNWVTAVQQGDVLESVVITRIGAAAQAFDASAHGLPSVLDAQPDLQSSTNGFELIYAQPANSEFFVFHSDDLGAWNLLSGMEMYGTTPLSAPRNVSSVTTNRTRKFFNVTKVQYADAIYTPPSVTGRKLTLVDIGNIGLAFSFSGATNGVYTFMQGTTSLGPYNVPNFGWSQEAYRGQLFAKLTGLAFQGLPVTDADISFVFTSQNGGTYAGNLIILTGDRLPIEGTFTATNL